MLKRTLATWIPLFVLVTLMCGLVYGVAQQTIRQSANDPQIQLAEDAAAALKNGITPQAVMQGLLPVDMAVSIAPFVIIYNDAGQPIIGNGFINNANPVPPPGVLNYVRTYGEDRVTWQTQQGYRFATVVTRYDGYQQGFVLAGRSLRESEQRVMNLTAQVVLAWIVTSILTFLALLLMDFWMLGRRR